MIVTWYPPANVPPEPAEYQPSAGTGGLLLLPLASTGGVLLQNPPWAGGGE